MLVHGFICEYASEDKEDKIYFYLKTLVSFGRHYINIEHRNEPNHPFFAKYQQILLSICYDYTGVTKENLAKLLIYNIKSILKTKGNILKNGIVVSKNVNNFTFVTFDNRDKTAIRVITKFNALLAYKKSNGDISADLVFLNPLYHNSMIVNNDFVEYEHKTLYLKKPLVFPEELAELYKSDGYSRISVLVSRTPRTVEALRASLKSLYLEYNLLENQERVYIKYSFPNSVFINDVLESSIVYLAYLKNIASCGYNFHKTIYFNHGWEGQYILHYTCNLNINMYNHSEHKSYSYNLFVVCIHQSNIAITVDDTGKEYANHAVQVIVPYRKVKKYELYEDRNFYDMAHIRCVINGIIKDSKDTVIMSGLETLGVQHALVIVK